VNVEKSDAPRGMNITFVSNAKTDQDAFELLTVLGLPFAKDPRKKTDTGTKKELSAVGA
jgi:hypothetical protein